MLEALFGNASVQNVLLFLFVNSKCYGSQLQKQLKSPLTPLQKALERLERGDILLSYYEGKTRVYQFNPSYPLLSELELLLKKTYALLPSHEKMHFSYIAKKTSQKSGSLQVLKSMWKQLSNTSRLVFHAKTKSKDGGGWNGQGKGDVTQISEGDSILIFHEKGSWKDRYGQDIDFTNVFRWTLDLKAKVISLEHLRRGINNPVFLFHLALDGTNSLASIDSHLCNEDAYFGKVILDNEGIKLKCRVIGPKKNEEIETYYT